MRSSVRTTCCLVLALGLGPGCLGGCGKKDETVRNDGETSGSTQKGAKIYLLEYTTDPELIGEIQAYCEAKGFLYYVSDSVELDG